MDRRRPNKQPFRGRQSHQKKERRKIYETYWPIREVNDGLQSGTLIRGPLKISPKNLEDAYVPDPDFSADVYIGGRVDMNRALNSDIVVVQIHQRQKWRVFEKAFEAFEKSQTEELGDSNGTSEDDDNSYDKSDDASEIDEDDASVNEKERGARGGREYSSGSSLVGAMAGLDISEGYKARTSCQTAPTQRPAGPARGGRENLNEEPTMQKDGGTPAEKKKKSSRKRVEVPSVSDMIKNGSPFAQQFFEDLVDDCLHEEIEDFNFLQRTGKVVYISVKNHPRIASGRLKFTSGKNNALFLSRGQSTTNFIIPTKECPRGFLERPEEFEDILYEAEIGECGEEFIMPQGKLTNILGKAGEIEAETKASLIEMNVDDTEFSREVRGRLPRAIPQSAFENRTDLRDLCVFTIDELKTKDMDDALSIQKFEDGTYQVGVHIADVGYFVKENSELDRVASERTTSVYLIQRVIPMLPELLSDDLCSLVPGQDRLAFSVMWRINEAGEVSRPSFDRTVIKSCIRMSFDDVQGFIEHPEKEWRSKELPPITGPFRVRDIKRKVLQLHKIAVKLRKQRIRDGALLLNLANADCKWNQEIGRVERFFARKEKDSDRLVQEFMLLANVAVAQKIKAKFPKKAILRRQASPKEHQLDNVAKFLDSVGLDIDVKDRQQLQGLLSRGEVGDGEEGSIKSQILCQRMKELMRKAENVCSGTTEDETECHHYSLNVPLFTHFTSPIRQYPDIMVHRLLAAALDSTATYPKGTDELQTQADLCNAKGRQVNTVQNDNIDMHFALFVKEKGPFVVPGMVMLVRMKSFDVFIPEYGMCKTVHLDSLPLESYELKKDMKCPALEIAWKENDHDRLTRHHIELFMPVTCRLTAEEKFLRCNCVIKRPEREIRRTTRN